MCGAPLDTTNSAIHVYDRHCFICAECAEVVALVSPEDVEVLRGTGRSRGVWERVGCVVVIALAALSAVLLFWAITRMIEVF